MSNSTPMMQQYNRLKSQHSDAILFFRLGDFYEMFKDDAREASQILGLTLTSRNGTPMCGIPHHAFLTYAPKLLEAGRKIALCEQTHLPEKGIADREVIQVLSPGTVIDESLISSSIHNFTASISHNSQGGISICLIDISTADLLFFGGRTEREDLRRICLQFQPSEILVQESLISTVGWVGQELKRGCINRFPDWYYDKKDAWKELCRILRVQNLKAFGLNETSSELMPLKPLLYYIETNTGKQIRRINSLKVLTDTSFLLVDSNSQQNLELITSRNGSQRSLFSVIDKTCTRMGRRLLQNWLLFPLIEIDAICERQNWVASLYHKQIILNGCRKILAGINDLSRLCVRIDHERANPKDLLAVLTSLRSYKELVLLLQDGDIDASLQSKFIHSQTDLETIDEIIHVLDTSLVDDPPVQIDNGGIIRSGFDDKIDCYREVQQNTQRLLDEYLESERENKGLTNLRIKHNGVIGYFLELPKGQSKNAPSYFELRQSLVTVDRYTSEKLKILAREIEEAKFSLIDREKDCFLTLRTRMLGYLDLLHSLADSIAILDCIQSFSYQATRSGYIRPTMVNNGKMEITSARHPVVEDCIDQGTFVPNNLYLNDSQYFALVTGPNMAGKSTFLRQTALIVLMAHMGSFIPAESAQIHLVDRIFCRVGASDNIARGESTFLVEMNETAHILRNASESSLIIMDEIGRGTSTQDGLAIATAVSEFILQKIRCKTLFATHFHELAELDFPGLKNLSLLVKEERGEVRFLNTVVDGPSSRSYGWYVAKIAGIPIEVLRRTQEILLGQSSEHKEADLGTGETNQSTKTPEYQKSLFAEDESVIKEILRLDLNVLTPIDALNHLHRFKKMLL